MPAPIYKPHLSALIQDAAVEMIQLAPAIWRLGNTPEASRALEDVEELAGQILSRIREHRTEEEARTEARRIASAEAFAKRQRLLEAAE